MIRKQFIIFFLFCFNLISLYSQQNIPDSLIYRLPDDTIKVIMNQNKNNIIKLDTIKFYHKTLRIYYKNFFLKKKMHYLYEEESSKVTILQKFSLTDTLTVSYKKIPFPEFSKKKLNVLQVVPPDTSDSLQKTHRLSVVQKFEKAFSEDVSDMKKSGSFVRGFQVGSNQSLTLNSSLNLFLKGNITENTSITAALTDENTPIQPEGNTQRLNEVDKVFIKIKSPYIQGTMGDFDFSLKESSLDRLQRKLQGIYVQSTNKAGNMSAIYASKRGDFHRNSFLGQEGNQGPYLLKGKNGERNIIILAGSERIYINGLLKKRGENLDYVIDYTTGEITFTSHLLISSESRIEVDFEYLDSRQRFGKNLYMARYKKKLFSRFSIKGSYYEEKDDIKNLLADSDPLSSDEKDILKSAGNNPDSAFISGIDSVGAGKGYYIKRDTVINSSHYQYYKYDRESGVYNVIFSSTESNSGSYNRKKLGEYEFVGPGNGNYDPIIRVPLPSKHRLYVTGFTIGDSSNNNISGEMGISDHDKNYLSSINDSENMGLTGTLNWKILKKAKLLGKKIETGFNGYWNHRDKKFESLDRYRRADFNRYWNIASLESENENRWENNLKLSVPKAAEYKFGIGEFKSGALNKSQRISHGLNLYYKKIFQMSRFEFIKRQNNNNEYYWQRHGGSIGYNSNKNNIIQFFGNYEYKQDRVANRIGGFENYSLGIDQKWTWNRSLNSELIIKGKDDYLFMTEENGKKLKQARVIQVKNQITYSSNKNFDTDVVFNFRNKDFSKEFENYSGNKQEQFLIDPQFQDTTWQDRKSYSMNMNAQWRLFNRQMTNRWEYTVASELTAIQEKVYLKVSGQLGNYRFDEDLQEYVPDTNGEYILVVIPSGSYMPTSKVLFNWQWEWRPSRDRKKVKVKSFFKKLVKSTRMTNRFKIEEKTNHGNLWDIYFLNFSQFQKDGETINGKFLWFNDINFLARHPVWNVRLNTRYQKQYLNMYLDASNNEKRKIWEQEWTLRFRASNHFKQEMDFKLKNNKRFSPTNITRNRDVSSYGAGTRSIFRIMKGVDNSVEILAFIEEDRRDGGALKEHYFKLKERLTASVLKKGRLTAQFQWYKVIIDKNPLDLPLPYEMAEGKKEGDSMEWSLRMDYFVSNNLTFTFNYRGRNDPIYTKTLHTGLMELRAFF